MNGGGSKRKGFQRPDFKRQHEARRKLTEPPCILSDEERLLVELTVKDHCHIRQWYLHAVICRTNHVHVVVTAPVAPELALEQFKAWGTRKLKERAMKVLNLSKNQVRKNWWTEDGSKRYLNDAASLERALLYVRDHQ